MTPEEIAAAEEAARKAAEEAAKNKPPVKTPEEEAAEAARLKAIQDAKDEEERRRNKPTDKEAELLKEVMKWKQKAKDEEARAKLFEGIDPTKAKAALDKMAEAERKEMEARGEYDRIIAQVTEQAEARVSAAQTERDALKAQLDAMEAAGKEKDVANAFANSPFVRENLTISGAKVRILFGSHFEYQGEELVAYDKPKGEKNRTPLVDGQGKNLSFEEALEKIVKADPDWKNMAKSNLRPGSNSNPSNLQPQQIVELQTSHDKIKAGLNGLRRSALNLRG